MPKPLQAISLLFVLFSTLQSFAQSLTNGCNLNSNGKPSEFYVAHKHAEDKHLDSFITKETNALRSFFSIQPCVLFCEDTPDSPEARSTKMVDNDSFPSGTILLGLNMLNKEFVATNNRLIIPFILAHQFAHIADLQKGLTKDSATKMSEQFADFQAGSFLCFSHINLDSASIVNFFSKKEYTLSKAPDQDAIAQRFEAIKSGYNWFQEYAMKKSKVDIDAILLAAKKYVGLTDLDEEESKRLVQNISMYTRPVLVGPGTSNTLIRYHIRIKNNNKYAVVLIIGGLSFGHYENIKFYDSEFVKDGEIEMKTVKVSANSNETVLISIEVPNLEPFASVGVPRNQVPKIISARKE